MTNMVILVNMAILMILVNLSSDEYGDSDKSFDFGEFTNFFNLVNSGFC